MIAGAGPGAARRVGMELAPRGRLEQPPPDVLADRPNAHYSSASMASRKEQKEQLRREREQREAEAKAAERRKRMIGYGVGGAIVAAAVVVLLVGVVAGGGGGGWRQRFSTGRTGRYPSRRSRT